MFPGHTSQVSTFRSPELCQNEVSSSPLLTAEEGIAGLASCSQKALGWALWKDFPTPQSMQPVRDQALMICQPFLLMAPGLFQVSLELLAYHGFSQQVLLLVVQIFAIFHARLRLTFLKHKGPQSDIQD